MPRREYYVSLRCTHEGCTETSFYIANTRAEQKELYVSARSWLCTRHTKPDEVLTADNLERTTVLESYETDHGYPGRTHRYWTTLERLDEKKGGNGFVYGHGFKAWAKDFPVGTRLIITARVEIPRHSHDWGPWKDDPAGVTRECACGAVDSRPEG